MYGENKKYVALKIKVDFRTGRRAGSIDPRDPGLICLAQNIEKGEEIRLVIDGRNIDVYRNIDGVEVIEGIDEIDKAIDELIPKDEQEIYDVFIPELFTASIIALHLDKNHEFDLKKIPDIDEINGNTVAVKSKILKTLKEHGVKGIAKRKIVVKMKDIVKQK